MVQSFQEMHSTGQGTGAVQKSLRDSRVELVQNIVRDSRAVPVEKVVRDSLLAPKEKSRM